MPGTGASLGGGRLEPQLSTTSPTVIPFLSAHPWLSCGRQRGQGGPHQLGGTRWLLLLYLYWVDFVCQRPGGAEPEAAGCVPLRAWLPPCQSLPVNSSGLERRS